MGLFHPVCDSGSLDFILQIQFLGEVLSYQVEEPSGKEKNGSHPLSYHASPVIYLTLET